MKIAILSASPRIHSTARLRAAAVARGHIVKVLNTQRFGIYVQEQDPELTFRSRTLSHYDAVIPRIGHSVTFFGTAVVRQFEQMGVFTLNSANAISVSRDKLRSLQILSRHHIGIPTSAFVRDKKDILPAIERVGGVPVIIKLLEGTQGLGVILAESIAVAESIIEALHTARQNVLIQKFVAESKGTDIRAFVVGDHVVAAMRRRATGDGFRSNVHRGGVTEKVELDEAHRRTAIQAAQILGLRVAGVDMLETSGGPKVAEVNSSPGLEGIEAATGVDVATAIIEYLEQQAKFEEFDIRQRLTFTKGYTIAEIRVNPDSELVGKTVAGSGLRDRDVIVLCLTRQELVIPNPKSTRLIIAGDILLCYGKQAALGALIPDLDSPKNPSQRLSTNAPLAVNTSSRADRNVTRTAS